MKSATGHFFGGVFGRLAGLAAALVLVIGVAAVASPSSQAATLEAVKARDQLICGINPNLPGWRVQGVQR